MFGKCPSSPGSSPLKQCVLCGLEVRSSRDLSQRGEVQVRWEGESEAAAGDSQGEEDRPSTPARGSSPGLSPLSEDPPLGPTYPLPRTTSPGTVAFPELSGVLEF